MVRFEHSHRSGLPSAFGLNIMNELKDSWLSCEYTQQSTLLKWEKTSLSDWAATSYRFPALKVVWLGVYTVYIDL